MKFSEFVAKSLVNEDISEQIKNLSERIKKAMKIALDSKEVADKEEENHKVNELRNKLMALKKKQREEAVNATKNNK